MPRALWNGHIIAESEHTELMDGDHYFPPDSLKEAYFAPSQTRSICPWKGTANYYHVQVEDDVNTDAAWFYPDPKEAAHHIKGYIAFWKGVEVVD